MPAYHLLTDTRSIDRFANLGLEHETPKDGLVSYRFQGDGVLREVQKQTLTVTQSQQTCICLPERNWKAIFFDMDSTVIAQESIVELARAAGKAREAHEITERAMAGELDFVTALKSRVAMLKGLSNTALDQVTAHLTINPGMQTLVAHAKAKGMQLFLVSGGFRSLAQRIVTDLQFNGFIASDLARTETALTGELTGPIIDAQAKADFLRKVCQQLSISTSDTLVVGDGANDLLMMQAGGGAIGYHPKPILLPQIHGANYLDHSILTRFM